MYPSRNASLPSRPSAENNINPGAIQASPAKPILGKEAAHKTPEAIAAAQGNRTFEFASNFFNARSLTEPSGKARIRRAVIRVLLQRNCYYPSASAAFQGFFYCHT